MSEENTNNKLTPLPLHIYIYLYLYKFEAQSFAVTSAPLERNWETSQVNELYCAKHIMSVMSLCLNFKIMK